MTEEPPSDPRPIDVFTHSSTGFPGAWAEEEITTLMNTWCEVLERAKRNTRRFDVAQRILRRLRSNKNFRRVEKEDVKKQIGRLRTEYMVYKGLLKIGLKTVRRPCVDLMEIIFDKIPSSRKRLDSTGGNRDGQSEDSDHSRRLSVSYDGDEGDNRPRTVSDSTRRDEANTTPRSRARSFQRRMNIQGFARVVVGQQRTLMEFFDKVLKSLENSNSRLTALMEHLVINKAEPTIETPSPKEEKADSA